MLSPYGQPQTMQIGFATTGAVFVCLILSWAIPAFLFLVFGGVLLATFRDPERIVPAGPGQLVAPADGRVVSVFDLENYEPFGGPARCVRIFLSLLNVHVNRCPCLGRVVSVTHKPGLYLSALKPECPEQNESVTLVLAAVEDGRPAAAVRQVSGAIARRIVCEAASGDILERGERFGMIKLGSVTELYIPLDRKPQVLVQVGHQVRGGETIVALVGAAGV